MIQVCTPSYTLDKATCCATSGMADDNKSSPLDPIATKTLPSADDKQVLSDASGAVLVHEAALCDQQQFAACCSCMRMSHSVVTAARGCQSNAGSLAALKHPGLKHVPFYSDVA